MADEDVSESTRSSSSAPVESDWLLKRLVNHADFDGIEIGITLNVSGILVSGILVGGKQYFEHFAKRLASGFSDAELSASVETSFSEYGKLYESADNDDQPLEPTFLHIRDVAFYSTNAMPIPSEAGNWWRGRLANVDGFMLGNLTARQT